MNIGVFQNIIWISNILTKDIIYCVAPMPVTLCWANIDFWKLWALHLYLPINIGYWNSPEDNVSHVLLSIFATSHEPSNFWCLGLTQTNRTENVYQQIQKRTTETINTKSDKVFRAHTSYSYWDWMPFAIFLVLGWGNMWQQCDSSSVSEAPFGCFFWHFMFHQSGCCASVASWGQWHLVTKSIQTSQFKKHLT